MKAFNTIQIVQQSVGLFVQQAVAQLPNIEQALEAFEPYQQMQGGYA